MDKIILSESLRKRSVFKEMHRYIEVIKEVVGKIDENAQVYLFGSVAEGREYCRDIDILIITEEDYARILAELWRHGVKDPFEIHIYPPKHLGIFKRRSKLLSIL